MQNRYHTSSNQEIFSSKFALKQGIIQYFNKTISENEICGFWYCPNTNCHSIKFKQRIEIRKMPQIIYLSLNFIYALDVINAF